MNNRTLIIAGGIAAITIVGVVVFLLTRSPQVNPEQGVDYTDAISSQIYTTAPTVAHEGEGEHETLPNQITITGLEDFFSSINQDQAELILTELTTFIRARIGAQSGAAGVLNSYINKTNDDPRTYEFTLVLQYPASRYKVAIIMPDTLTAPEIMFTELAQ